MREVKKTEQRNLMIKPILSDNKISGTAVVFDKRSGDLGGFDEIINRDALNGVDLSDVLLLYNHDFGSVLARTSAGSLELNVDDTGVHFNAELPKTTLGNDVRENLSNGNVRGMSFGFTIDDRDWEEHDNGFTQVVKRIGNIYEISITSFPAYQETDVQLSQRSLDSFKNGNEEKANYKEWLALQKEMYGG